MALFGNKKKEDRLAELAQQTGARVVVDKSIDQSFSAYVKRQFRKNKLALWSLYFAGFLAVIALLADFIANEKPIVCKYNGKVMFPVLKDYGVTLGISKWDAEYVNLKWSEADFNWVVWPLIPYLPNNIDTKNEAVGPFEKQEIKSGKWKHWLGTATLGRDVMAGMVHGTRVAFLVGILSMSISTLLGIFLGSLAGYYGDDKLKTPRIRAWLYVIFGFLGFYYGFGSRGFVISDALSQSVLLGLLQFLIGCGMFAGALVIANLLSRVLGKIKYLGERISIPLDIMITRLIEIFVSIPRLILIMSIIAIVKPSIYIVMIVIGATSWTGIARFIRAELLRVRSLEYIEAAQALGYTNWRIMMKHAIPNSLSPVFISVAFGIASAILVESTLSFLGIGVPAETITWGKLLAFARQDQSAWWLAVFPGFAIFITVTVFNLIGEGLTDALDPRQKR